MKVAKPVNRKEKEKTRAARGVTKDFKGSASNRGSLSATTILRTSSCACGGGCPGCQAKSNDFKVSQPNDAAEVEADQIADKVMRMPADENAGSAAKTGAQGESRHIQRSGNLPSKSPVPHGLNGALNSSGHRLDSRSRNFFEPRFGQDLGHVRIHRDAASAEFSENLNARALTIGSDIAFANGQYDPDSNSGRRLLAHELTHVVQQSAGSASSGIAREVNYKSSGVIQREEFEPWPGQLGTDVPKTYQKKGDVIRERVQRTGDKNYATSQPGLLEFDTKKCKVTATKEIEFKNIGLKKKEFNTQKQRFLDIANKKLNGWIAIEVGNDKGCSVCKGRMMKVNVVAKEGSGKYASKVNIRTGSARENAGNIYASSSESTLWHEAGHIVLGAADEYPDSTPPKGKKARPDSRVNQSDFSIMSNSGHLNKRRFRMFARHFSHIAAWLGRRFPDCKFETKELYNPFSVDADFRFAVSATSIGGGWGLGLDIDATAGIPLEKLHRVRLLLGGYASMMSGFGKDNRLAFMAGALIGLDFSTNRSGGGFGGRLDLRAGGAFATPPQPASSALVLTPTIGGTIGFGYSGPIGHAGAEFGVGKFLGKQFKEDDPYFSIGFKAGLSF